MELWVEILLGLWQRKLAKVSLVILLLGLIGGGVGGSLLGPMLGGGMGGSIGAAAGGGILMVIIGLIKSAMAK